MNIRSNPKYSCTSPSIAANYLINHMIKDYICRKIDKINVQRSSPDGRVEPEVYAGRKILL